MSQQFNYNGEIHLILGSMFASKTTELIRHYNRHSIAGKKCVMVKYKNDIRYDLKMIVTHDNIKAEALICEYLYEIDNQVQLYDVICIDEVQFYKDGHIFCDKWANQNKIIIACGLNGTFNRTPFPVISKLIPLTENITFLKAVCKETGDDAVYSKLNIVINDNITELIGGSEKYTAVDRKTFFKNNNHLNELIKEFIEIYLLKHNKSENLNLPIIEYLNKNSFDNDYVSIAKNYTQLCFFPNQ